LQAKAAEEDARKKRLAREAEQERLAAEAERKRLAAEAEAKRLAAEAENKRIAEAAEKKRLAEEAEQKRLAEELKAKLLAAEVSRKLRVAEAEKTRIAEKKARQKEQAAARLAKAALEEAKKEAAVAKAAQAAKTAEAKAARAAEIVKNIPPSPIVFAEAKVASLPASSQLDAGLRAYESRDYVKALKSWLPVADSGNANAQFYVGGLFRDGAGVPTDLPRAHLWWSLAAKGGHKAAARFLNELRTEMLPHELVEAAQLVKSHTGK